MVPGLKSRYGRSPSHSLAICGGSNVISPNAVSGQVTLFRVSSIPITTSDSATYGCANRSKSRQIRMPSFAVLIALTSSHGLDQIKWIRRIGCLLSSRSCQRAPLQLVSSASDMMLYVDFGACAPPKQHCTHGLGSGKRSFGAPTAYCRAD